jgi:SPP1 gp7 family putative phage head morphogenesis protein
MSKYWEERSAQREIESQLIVEKYLSRMNESLKQAQQDVIRQIEAFYARYARDNVISLKDARKLLTSKEMKEFQEVDLKRFREMALSGNPQYENLLNAISYRVRISRLEALHAQIEMIMLQLYGGANGLQQYTYTGLAEVYKNSYYHFMYDFAMAGVGGTVQLLTDDMMKGVLSYNWSGKEFSTRIWGHQASTIDNVKKALESKFTAGHSIHKTTKTIVDVTGVAYSRAEALVRTESSFFHNLAAQNSYVDSGNDRYEILATLDFRTSEKCRDQDGKIYNQVEYAPGKTAPPFHVRCRTTTIPYFDEEEYMQDEKRQTLDGPIDSIPYQEWIKPYQK